MLWLGRLGVQGVCQAERGVCLSFWGGLHGDSEISVSPWVFRAGRLLSLLFAAHVSPVAGARLLSVSCRVRAWAEQDLHRDQPASREAGLVVAIALQVSEPERGGRRQLHGFRVLPGVCPAPRVLGLSRGRLLGRRTGVQGVCRVSPAVAREGRVRVQVPDHAFRGWTGVRVPRRVRCRGGVRVFAVRCWDDQGFSRGSA